MNRLPLSLCSTALLPVLLLTALAAPSAFAQITGTPQEDDRFGQAVATGDFDGDGRDDLAVGVPGECVGSFLCALEAGAVHVVYGTISGLDDAGDQFWHQNSPGIGNTVHPNDRFGSSLAAGDFDGDGYDDLAVGVPFEDYNGLDDVGQVHVLYGSPSGLTAAGDFLLPSIPGAHEGMLLGLSLAAGDFDGDGRDDLALGVPNYNVGSPLAAIDAGVVAVLFGSNNGIKTGGYQVWHQNRPGVEGAVEPGDRFGYSLAAGDFDADGRDDLAVGVPNEDIGSIDNGGAVHVLYGTNSGLAATGDQLWSQNTTGIVFGAEANDYFGWAVAAGDFDGDGRDDLAAGVPFEDVGSIGNAGAVNVIYGTNSGLTAAGNQVWHQDVSGVESTAEASDFFGLFLTAGNFNGDGRDDLAVGVPYEDAVSNTVINAGAVSVLYGASGSLSSAGDQIWTQHSTGIEGGAEGGDLFGLAVAAGDFNGNGRDDLAIGVPYEDLGSVADAGAANVIYGTTSGLTSAGNHTVYQGRNLRVASGGETEAVIASEGGSESGESSEAASSALPEAVALHAPYPNPVRQRATLGFALPEAGPVRLAVYDLLGRTVAVLVDATREAGTHDVVFDAAGLPSGTYLVRLEAGGTAQTQHLTLVR